MADLHFTDLLQQLTAHRSRFGKTHEQDKTGLLEFLSGMKPRSKTDILHYHELLLFFMTYPDSKEFFNKVVTAMGRLKDQLKQSSLQHPDKFSNQYDGSGIVYSSIDWKPTVDACKWLLRTFSSDVTLNWSDEFADRFGPFLTFFCSRAEQDGLTNDRFDAKDWMMLASGAGEGQENEQLRYLLKKMESLQADAMLTDYIFDVLSPEVHIRLNHPLASRTTNIITCDKLFYQGEPLVRDFNPIKQLNKKIAPVKKLASANANKIIDTARAVLAVRCRETDPFSYAGEVRQADLERGLRLYLFSMIPERRMPLENYTGFLALRNGVPIGYGGGWIFGERCEIGVNVFETFRGGENSYIFTNILRVYNRVFGIKLFAVPPYQFGADNDEGLKSGAFWFYYKLGFRPADESLALLAASEAQKIEKDKKYHSSIKTLKQLAEYPLELKNGRTKFRLQPKQISIVITKWIAKNFRSDHEAATRWCINKLKALPGMKSMSGSSANEKKSLNYLAIFLVLPDKTNSLTAAEKKAFVELIRLKGGDEIRYSLLLRQQSKLLMAWQRLVDDDLIS